MRTDGIQANERFLVFDDQRPVEVYGVEALDKKLKAKSEPQLRQEVCWGKQHHKEEFRNAALVAEMELDRRAVARAERLAMRTTCISVGAGAISAILGALAGAFLTG